MEKREKERLKPDLKVLNALYKKAYLPKTADKIFKKLEAKGLCEQWAVNRKREYEKKDNYFKVCLLNDLDKELCAYLKAVKHAKNKRKD
ncbi:hypothetical protein [Helicobacter phage COL 5-PUJ]|uniref:hypothetical protein n=1 Tax=Helicobacter pylori TaxID=210 RepID=UPI00193317F4|nr:hypothetical protein [Helicobacter pylori]MBS3011093.1 hypothetical protein [Helicobacter pylori]MBS3017003.1 hypothetical protein [Helicobacter pylori]QQO40040.1 hypothetical protein [Helicobacter phage COL 5-PUJ]QQO40071.1 hypothetical protein [Helicobacter phage COL 6-PUJ]